MSKRQHLVENKTCISRRTLMLVNFLVSDIIWEPKKKQRLEISHLKQFQNFLTNFLESSKSPSQANIMITLNFG